MRVLCFTTFENGAPFCEGIRFQLVWLWRTLNSNFVEWITAGLHHCQTPCPPPHYPSLISGFSCGPTPDNVWLRCWDVITFTQQALSNQDNWHQTADYKARVGSLLLCSHMCLLVDNPDKENVLASIKSILRYPHEDLRNWTISLLFM